MTQIDANGRDVIDVPVKLGADAQRICALAADHEHGQVFAVVGIADFDDLAVVLDLAHPAASLLPLLDDLRVPILDEDFRGACGVTTVRVVRKPSTTWAAVHTKVTVSSPICRVTRVPEP